MTMIKNSQRKIVVDCKVSNKLHPLVLISMADLFSSQNSSGTEIKYCGYTVYYVSGVVTVYTDLMKPSLNSYK